MIPAKLKQKYGAFRMYLFGGAVLAFAGYIGFTYGNKTHEWQQNDIAQLKQTLANVDEENNRLTRDLNVLGVELEVQRLANKEAQKNIELGLLRENELKRELGFYQKVMAPELKQKGFSIDGFDMKPLLSDQRFRFELVLMQHEGIKTLVKGNVRVNLTGTEGGKPTSYSLRKLMDEGSKPLAFGFKYFQVLEGEVTLPEGFVVEQAIVKAEIFQFNRKRGDLEKRFEMTTPSQQVTKG